LSQFLKSYAVLVFLIGFWAASITPMRAEELHNLEIVFKKTYDGYADSVRNFGSDICSIGDVNGDGYDDFAAAGWEYDLRWRSLVFVFLGGATLDTIPYLILRDDYRGGIPYGRLTGGDVNGDGFSDVVVGLPYGPGNVDIYFGGNPMDTIVDLCFTESAPEEYFGCAVATGDINGDGYCDVVAADYMKDNRGAVYVYYGGPLLDNLPDVRLNGHGSEGFGTSVASAGDVNSDGYDDVVIGAPDNSDLYWLAGAVYVY